MVDATSTTAIEETRKEDALVEARRSCESKPSPFPKLVKRLKRCIGVKCIC